MSGSPTTGNNSVVDMKCIFIAIHRRYGKSLQKNHKNLQRNSGYLFKNFAASQEKAIGTSCCWFQIIMFFRCHFLNIGPISGLFI